MRTVLAQLRPIYIRAVQLLTAMCHPKSTRQWLTRKPYPLIMSALIAPMCVNCTFDPAFFFLLLLL